MSAPESGDEVNEAQRGGFGRDVNTQRQRRHFAIRPIDSVVTGGIDMRMRTEIPGALPIDDRIDDSPGRTTPIILLHRGARQITGRVRYPYAFASLRIIDAHAPFSRV
jgi:hypothetical protein